jgi:hypothetical protein
MSGGMGEQGKSGSGRGGNPLVIGPLRDWMEKIISKQGGVEDVEAALPKTVPQDQRIQYQRLMVLKQLAEEQAKTRAGMRKSVDPDFDEATSPVSGPRKPSYLKP